MGKYLDKTGLQYFYNKLKDKFADKSTIETKLDSLTGAFTWKGELSALPTDLSGYSAGSVIKVGTKEYVCTETNGTKSWDELGDEGSYLLKTAAESTYLKKAAGEVKTDNLADGSVTKAKLDTSVQTSLGKADNAVQLGATNEISGSNATTLKVNNVGGGRIDIVSNTGTTSISGNNIAVGSPSSEISTVIFKRGIDFMMQGTKFGSIKVNSNNKLQITGLDTPTSDTDAANKAYVDDKVNKPVLSFNHNNTDAEKSKAITDFIAAGGSLESSFELKIADVPYSYGTFELHCDMFYCGKNIGDIGSEEIPAYQYIGVCYVGDDSPNVASIHLIITESENTYGAAYVDNMRYCVTDSGLDSTKEDMQIYTDNALLTKVDKSTLATSLKAITIYTDNTTEHKAANLANIKAYEDNLKALRVDVTKGWSAPAYCKHTNFSGVLSPLPNGDYAAVGSATAYNVMYYINSTGAVNTHYLLDAANSYSSLTTTSKTVIGAINEVNAAKITGVKINGETKTPTSGVIDLGTISGGSEDPVILNPGTESITNAEFTKLMNAVGTRSAYYNTGDGCYFSLIYVSQDSSEAVFKFQRPSSDGEEVLTVITEPYDSLKETIAIIARSSDSQVFSNAGYQPTLVSGTNIKTINGNSILGSGNLTISSTTDTTMSDTSTNPVQNKVIKAYIDGLVGDAITQLSEI